MWFRHLDYPPDTAAADLGPAAIDALLERGDLDDWTPLLREVARDPWSPTAETILRICDANPMYGTSTLWRRWIEACRRRERAKGTTLAEARRRAGLTQRDVAERMGISQSDVSKLERRTDVRLSTLRSYATAIGAHLFVGLEGPDEGEEPTPLRLPARRKPRGADPQEPPERS